VCNQQTAVNLNSSKSASIHVSFCQRAENVWEKLPDDTGLSSTGEVASLCEDWCLFVNRNYSHNKKQIFLSMHKAKKQLTYEGFTQAPWHHQAYRL